MYFGNFLLINHNSVCERPGFNPWVRKISWRRKWQPTPIFLPGKSHGQRNLVGYSPWGRKESDTTEQLHFLSLSKRKKNPCTTLRYVPSVPTFQSFYHEWMLNFIKSFILHPLQSLLMWYITLIDFQILKSRCIPGINPT